MFNWSDLIAGICIVALSVIVIAALFITGRNNGDQFQEYRLACIEAGGSVVEGNCVYPRPVPLS